MKDGGTDMDQADRNDDHVVDAAHDPAVPHEVDDAPASGWASPVVQTLSLTSGPSTTDSSVLTATA